MDAFKIGDIFTGEYPPETSDWCMQNSAMIVAVGDGTYEIQAVLGPSKNETIMAEITALESLQTRRRVREASLSEEGRAWLQNLENQIAAKRAELVSI